MPKDATTNPSLILKACESNDNLCNALIDDAIKVLYINYLVWY